MSQLKSAVALVMLFLLGMIYLGALLLISVFAAAIALSFLGISPFSTIGLILTAFGSGLYVLFEGYAIATGRDAPVLVIVLVIATMPLTVWKGIDSVVKEYRRLRELIGYLPRIILSYLIPTGLPS